MLGVMLAGEGCGVHGSCSRCAVSHCAMELFRTLVMLHGPAPGASLLPLCVQGVMQPGMDNPELLCASLT